MDVGRVLFLSDPPLRALVRPIRAVTSAGPRALPCPPPIARSRRRPSSPASVDLELLRRPLRQHLLGLLRRPLREHLRGLLRRPLRLAPRRWQGRRSNVQGVLRTPRENRRPNETRTPVEIHRSFSANSKDLSEVCLMTPLLRKSRWRTIVISKWLCKNNIL